MKVKPTIIGIGLGAITGLFVGNLLGFRPGFLFIGHVLGAILGKFYERSKRPIRRARKLSKTFAKDNKNLPQV